MRVVLVVVVLVLVVVTCENKVNSYSDQLKLGQVCKFGVEFDKIPKGGGGGLKKQTKIPNFNL